MDSTGHTLPFRLVARKVRPDGELLKFWDLKGGLSAQVTAIEIGVPGGPPVRAVVRRFGAADLGRNPDIARDQFELHMTLHRHGLLVPKPLLYDDSCSIFEVPFLVLEYIEGSTDLAPQDFGGAVFQMAAHLAEIHNISGVADIVSTLPHPEIQDAPDCPASEEKIRELLRSVMPLPRRNLPALLHGDYWPGNVLWEDGRLAAIIDWEDASVGDPLVDVSNARLEILWVFGPERMEEFTRHYRERMPKVDLTDLPYWDLYAAVRLAPSVFAGWGLEADKGAIMRKRHSRFVEQALKALQTPEAIQASRKINIP